MKVFINAISIVKGGGIAVLNNLLLSMSKIDPNIEWYVAAEPNIIEQLPKNEKIIGMPFLWHKKTPLHSIYWYEITLPKILREIKADICFSHTNFLPRRKLPCPSLLLVQQAGYFSEKFKQLYFYWNKSRLNKLVWKQKVKWVHNSIKKATLITVQTQALAQQIIDQLGISKKKIITVPHGIGLIQPDLINPKLFPRNTNQIWRIGYITKWGVQKDFDTALKAIQILKLKGYKLKFILTLDENASSFFNMLQHIKKKISEYKIGDVVENQNDIVDINKMIEIYNSLHLFIFPSLCESFGFPLVEAMAAKLPVVVADTNNNREIIGMAGELVPSENAEKLAEKIELLLNNKNLYRLASTNSFTRSLDFSWNKSGKNILNLMNSMLEGHK